MTVVTLYGANNCELCDQAEVLIEAVIAELDRSKGDRECAGFLLKKVDINSDPVLKERYGWLIPVLLKDGGERELCWPFPPSRVRSYLMGD